MASVCRNWTGIRGESRRRAFFFGHAASSRAAEPRRAGSGRARQVGSVETHRPLAAAGHPVITMRDRTRIVPAKLRPAHLCFFPPGITLLGPGQIEFNSPANTAAEKRAAGGTRENHAAIYAPAALFPRSSLTRSPVGPFERDTVGAAVRRRS